VNRYEVRPTDYHTFPSGEIDTRYPAAWGVWDTVDEKWLGRVWYKEKQAAQVAVDVFNGKGV